MTLRRLTMSTIAAAVVAAALPAAASATTIVTPGGMTFPDRQVATQSDPQTATVQVFCTPPSGNGMGVCPTPDVFAFNPQIVGDNPGDFSVTNLTCPGALPNNGIAPGVCQFQVRFKPTAAGSRSAVLIAGAATSSAPNPIALSGTAVAAPPTGQRAAALAKCKKKKTKKKRKKCRAKANQLPE
jgi:hypothetical protein